MGRRLLGVAVQTLMGPFCGIGPVLRVGVGVVLIPGQRQSLPRACPLQARRLPRVCRLAVRRRKSLLVWAARLRRDLSLLRGSV